jgi:hypothetical protein
MRPVRLRAVWLAAWLAAAVATPARADRPFLATTGAAAEEDDDRVWSVEAWAMRVGDRREFVLSPEYAFSPTDSIQFALGRMRERGGERSDGGEIEFKHLFNRIAREGWGWGLALAVTAERPRGERWKGDAIALRLPISLALGEEGALLHLNAGVEKARDTRRSLGGSIAFEQPLPWRSTGFVEVARGDGVTLWHAGVRHWIRRERIAFDLGLVRERGDDERRGGVVIGIGFYDL